jgi:N-acyl-L-homoserine lactone synthetase
MMFDDRYEVVLADTESSKAIHYHLRYQVFCLEKGFETADRFRNRMEKDRFDEHAVHFLVREKKRNKWIGAARLVIGPLDNLPIRQVTEVEGPNPNTGAVIAEFSRLLVLDQCRHANHNGIAEPEVLLGLFRAARAYCRQQDIDQWVFLCRRSIYRILSNVGIQLEQIGPACQHRGLRLPYRMDLKTAFDGVADRSYRAHRLFDRPLSYYPYSAVYEPAARAELAA